MPDTRTDLLGTRTRRTPPSWPTAVVVAIALVGLGLLLLSLWRVQTDVAAAPTARSYTLATAHAGKVGQSVPIRAEVRWSRALASRNLLEGTVTSVDLADVTVARSGQRLYSVDLHPVYVASGSTPAFRDLSEDLEGPDVRQLQQMLAVEGWLHSYPDGIFGPSTTAAVKRWQKAEGEDATGVVAKGRVQFVPKLPARLVLDAQSVSVGAALVGGESAIMELSTDPLIEATLSPDLLNSVRDGASVTLSDPEHPWSGVVRHTQVRDDGTGTAVLGQRDGSSCGKSCPFTPGSGDELQARGEIVIVPETTGTVVPVAALHSGIGGEYLLDAKGRHVPVTVRASAGGQAVVDGIEPRRKVRVSAEAR